MHVNEWLRAIAGALIVISVGLAYLVSPWFLLFTAFVGLNLFQSAFTRWCPMMSPLRRLGVRD
jgi:hypothetical protein